MSPSSSFRGETIYVDDLVESQPLISLRLPLLGGKKVFSAEFPLPPPTQWGIMDAPNQDALTLGVGICHPLPLCCKRGGWTVRKVHPIVREIEDQIREVVEGLGYELVLVTYGGPAKRPTLTVYIDRRGGVNINDCSIVSERLSVLLDVLDPIPTAYDLIVSSPGLERPLVREQDFERFVGRKASVKQVSATGQVRRVEGWLRGTQDRSALIEHDGQVESIPMEEIEEAHLVYDWDEDEGRKARG